MKNPKILRTSYMDGPLSFVSPPPPARSLRSKFADCPSPPRQDCENLVRRRQLVNSSSNSPTMRASSPTTPDALLSTSNFVILCSLGGKYILSFSFLSRSQRSPPFSCTFVRPSTFLHPFPRKSSLKRGSALFASLRRLSHSALMMRAAKKSVQWRSLLPLIE